MESEHRQTTSNHSSGQSVSVSLGEGFRQAGWIICALIVALVVCGVLSLRAYDKAKDAEYESARWAMWGQTLEANLIASGFKVPPSPARENN